MMHANTHQFWSNLKWQKHFPLLAFYSLKRGNNEFNSRAAVTCEMFSMLSGTTMSHVLPMASNPREQVPRIILQIDVKSVRHA